MTDTQTHKAIEDLAFLRQLVDEEDWRKPTRYFGATYLAIGLAIIGQVAVIDTPVIPSSGLANLIAIVAVWVAYSIAQTVINAKLNPGKIGASLRGRAGAAGFLGMVLSHLTLLIVFLITAVRQQDGIFMMLVALSFFALQGGMWLMLHTLRRERWQLAVALGWFAGAIACAPFVGSSLFGYAVAGVVLLLMVVPGLHMLRVAGKRG